VTQNNIEDITCTK